MNFFLSIEFKERNTFSISFFVLPSSRYVTKVPSDAINRSGGRDKSLERFPFRTTRPTTLFSLRDAIQFCREFVVAQEEGVMPSPTGVGVRRNARPSVPRDRSGESAIETVQYMYTTMCTDI